VVPEAEPVPHTARAVLDAFGDRAIGFLGGDGRERYRTWLGIQAGRHDVVVGTRPAVFAPVDGLGLIWVSREVHPAHREDRAPYYHVREVAAARARIEGAACVLASLCPSVDTAAGIRDGTVLVRRPPRQAERAAAPLVETTPPEAEDRSVRLGALLKRSSSGALLVTRTGYGVARVCRSCGSPAACGACGGWIVVEHGTPMCRACGAPGRCRRCGATAFGVERGGLERVAEWAGRLAPVPVERAGGNGGAHSVDHGSTPGPGRIVVGTAAAVLDLPPVRLDLVGILDPDRALGRSDLHAAEQVLAIWMEAAAWAGPKRDGGRVLLQTRHPGTGAVQALIRWDPLPFLARAGEERAAGGFPPNHATFRIDGPGRAGLADGLRALDPTTILETPVPAGTVCLVAVRPAALRAFRDGVLDLVARGVITRVEAEPSF
jgi:primosomal protein N' (replication factor Y)